jgi:TPR repeat protein
MLGVLYESGKGVPQDYTLAFSWYYKAAEQGDDVGQYMLGFMYFSGRGVPQDYTQGYAWYNLAAAQGFKKAIESRDFVLKHMTSVQVAEGQKLSHILAQQIAKGGRVLEQP